MLASVAQNETAEICMTLRVTSPAFYQIEDLFMLFLTLSFCSFPLLTPGNYALKHFIRAYTISALSFKDRIKTT